MNGQSPEVRQLLDRQAWHEERIRLRSVMLDRGLEERVKWGKLCYSFNGGNVAIILALKTYCAVGFFKGALLHDTKDMLIAPGRHSRAMRQMRFSSLAEIEAGEQTLAEYTDAAIRIEKDGREVDFDRSEAPAYPDELRDAFDTDPDFAAAFATLTPGRQRGYVIHFSNARQSATRVSRIEKSRPRIFDGKGPHDR